jgi:hypothetical protein
MDRERANFFEFADSELAHSALWAWMIQCAGEESEEFKGVRELVGRFCAECGIPPLSRPNVKRAVNYVGGHIDLEVKDSSGTCLLIENTSRAVSEITRIGQFYSADKEKGRLHCVLLTTAFDVDERSASRKGAWRFVGLDELVKLLAPYKEDSHWILREYAGWLEKENAKRRVIAENAKCDDLARFTEALWKPEGQWALVAAMTREMSGLQYRGTSRGRPWTQFRFVKEGEGRDTLYYRLDVPGKEPVLEVKQYLSVLPADVTAKQERLIALRKLFKHTAASFPEIKQAKFMHTNEGKECPVARMELHPVSQFLETFPKLHAAYVEGLREVGLG